ncbi:MAG: DUF2332 domain-containing protein [Hyphomicrobiales bacterium]
MPPNEEKVRSAFRAQAEWCRRLGSPFTALLCDVLADRLDRSTGAGRAVLSWPGNPDAAADSLPLRLAGALNALVRRGEVPDLAAHYPPNPLPEAESFWRALHTTLGERSSEIIEWLHLAPQTNEVARSAVLFAGLSYLASLQNEPMELYEVGASAGLNLNLDRYGYRFGAVQFGDPGSSLQLSPSWTGALPPLVPVRIAARKGCDVSPLDARREQDRERLLAYVWPDQAERAERLARALEIAARYPVKVEQADAADWVERNIRPNGFPVLMHSIAFQYFPRATQERITALMAKVATASSTPLAWLRFELDPALDKQFSLRLRLGRVDRLLAIAGPHGTPIEWLVKVS